MENNLKKLAVYCGSSAGNSPKIKSEARRVGQFLAKGQIDLVFGAGKIGIMGLVVESVLENGGNAIGVIPEFLKHKEIVHLGLNQLITTKTMHERKQIMTDLSDGFVILPGGFGTMDEFFEVLTWSQLGLHQKPIGILNVDGYYDDLLQLFDKMVEKRILKKENQDLILVADNMPSLYEQMINFSPKATPKWLK